MVTLNDPGIGDQRSRAGSEARIPNPGSRVQTPLSADIIGGVTTFFTMAYIVVVNPSILSTPGTVMPFTGAMTATVLIAFSMTLLMGLYARLPRGRAGHGPERVLSVHDRVAATRRGRPHSDGVLGRRAVPPGVRDSTARSDRAGDSSGLRPARPPASVSAHAH
jgi:hypothetical protein